MRSGVIAQKLGMSRVFTATGEHVPVTVLKIDGCQVVAQRTKDRHGYNAVQLGVGTSGVTVGVASVMPCAVRPNSNFVSAMMIPLRSA